MKTYIQKWGNSLGLRIPAKIASQFSLKEGKAVDIVVEKDHLVIYPCKYQLAHMLELITKKNIHNQEFADDIRGKKLW